MHILYSRCVTIKTHMYIARRLRFILAHIESRLRIMYVCNHYFLLSRLPCICNVFVPKSPSQRTHPVPMKHDSSFRGKYECNIFVRNFLVLELLRCFRKFHQCLPNYATFSDKPKSLIAFVFAYMNLCTFIKEKRM